MTLFEYLNKEEGVDRSFTFGVASGRSMYISYSGYKHMNLFKISDVLQKKYKLRFDFKLGIEKYDLICGKTFIYFKDVYKYD